MNSSWLVLFMVVAIFVSMILLAIVCLDCRTNGPPVSISQGNASDEYIPSTNFRVIHPYQPSIGVNSIHPSSNLLSPFSPSTETGSQRHRSFTLTETESNPADGPDYINTESDQEDTGYITVLPEGEALLNNQSRASTPSSDVLHDYENIPKTVFVSSEDYLNVDKMATHISQPSTPDLSAQSSSSSSSSSSDDDDEGNYVNQPPMLNCQPSA